MSYATTTGSELGDFIEFLSILPGCGRIMKAQRALEPLPKDTKTAKKAIKAMQDHLHAFLKAEAPKMAAQVMKRLHKADEDEMTPAEDAAVSAALDTIDFSGWTVLVTDDETILEEIFKDQAIAALAQVGIDVEANKDVMNIVNERALQYARERAAEMVGMRRDELGNLYPNPNAMYQITEATREMMRGDVETAINEGWTTEELANALADSYGFSEDRAMTIARTEVNFAQSQGALDGYKASNVVQGKLWLTADDDLVEEICEENADAGVLGLDDEFPSGDEAPPAHPNCLLGDSLVTPCGRVSATSERWYDGNVIVIRTASGKNLTCTPNHPVLTDSGFIAAGLLDEGSKVISSREWKSASNNHGNNVVSSIKDIAEAFRCSSKMAATEVPISAEDFHGDGAGSHVAVIRADRSLRDCRDAFFFQGPDDYPLQLTDTKPQSFYSFGALNLFLHRMLASTTGFMRRLHLAFSGFGGHLLPFQRLSFALTAPSYTAFGEQSADGVAGYSKRESDFILADAGQVFTDNIISIETQSFHGMVFNIETERGYYIANGIITHNCRCAIAPVVDFDMPDADPTAQTQTEEE